MNIAIPNTFKDLLVMLGSPAFIGVVISVLLTKWAWFVNLGSTAKFWIVGGVSLLLPLLSQALITYLPTAFVSTIETWYPAFVVGMGVWVSTQVWNKLFGINGAVSKAADPTVTITK